MPAEDWVSRLVDLWKGLPEQVKRLAVVLAVIIVVFAPVKRLLVPADFGRLGHYRASALDDAAAVPLVYAGRALCNDCHDDVVDTKAQGYHEDLACEICHGAALVHANDPDSGVPPAPRDRGYCPICHEYLQSRPTGFPQIVSVSHNPLKPCITCHDPHDPVPPETPKECNACHASIARSKESSPHVYLECTDCHDAPEEHRVSPRQYLPGKPSAREFCGGCHDTNADSSAEIPRVDLETHGQPYVCWQCHYPHHPEAR